jgi:hypothetical protein
MVPCEESYGSLPMAISNLSVLPTVWDKLQTDAEAARGVDYEDFGAFMDKGWPL